MCSLKGGANYNPEISLISPKFKRETHRIDDFQKKFNLNNFSLRFIKSFLMEYVLLFGVCMTTFAVHKLTN